LFSLDRVFGRGIYHALFLSFSLAGERSIPVLATEKVSTPMVASVPASSWTGNSALDMGSRQIVW
jgi:hypothetical protein